ncbi:sodium:solute symporter family protein [Ancylomarina salipaludis]|uniref:Sodium:solute symporter family protein n=1 Tax=Ancylomarina salipaludis TaxID=2501299 RepID=A0A4Q1JKH5_9BACT|nr:sodium:solute symporter family protein [Ancylomarina salipaludis]RXQ90992.1 sodium:solute symporter family protein [Ancylomarina salipaludis]
MPSLQILSIALLTVYVILIVGSSLLSKKSDSVEGYFLANRSLSFVALAITFIASWWGAGSAIETADHSYQNGISAFWIYGMPVLFSTGLLFVFARAIRKVGSITQPQLLEERYGKAPALMLSVLIFLFMTITAASQIVGIGIFFEKFLHINYKLSAIIGTAIVLLYSFFGGFKAVVRTDIIQFIFLLSASILVFGYAYYYSGGIPAIESIAETKELTHYFSFSYQLSNNMVYIITFGSAWMIQANVWQRISAARSPLDARKMIGLSFLVYIPLYLMVTFTGMLALGLFEELPQGGVISGIINNYMPPLLGALIFVGICSAIMSTMDSLINTGAMVLCVDIYKNKFRPKASQTQLLWMGKIGTLVVTLIALLIGLEIRSILKVSWLAADLLSTGAFVPLMLGFIWKRGTSFGAMSSMLFGSLFSLYNLAVALGAQLPLAWEIGTAKHVLVGMLGSALVYFIASFFSKAEPDKSASFIAKAALKK